MVVTVLFIPSPGFVLYKWQWVLNPFLIFPSLFGMEIIYIYMFHKINTWVYGMFFIWVFILLSNYLVKNYFMYSCGVICHVVLTLYFVGGINWGFCC